MMKKTVFLLTALLTACSAPKPNLVHTHEPIVNITAELDPKVEVGANLSSAYVKNVTKQLVSLNYLLTWYNAQGVTQVFDNGQEGNWQALSLNPEQKHTIELLRPTADSVNYRLYLKQ